MSKGVLIINALYDATMEPHLEQVCYMIIKVFDEFQLFMQVNFHKSNVEIWMLCLSDVNLYNFSNGEHIFMSVEQLHIIFLNLSFH